MKINKNKQKSYMLMVYHQDTLWSAIKWWLFNRNKHCHQFCPVCEYYFRCQEDVEAEKIMEE